MKVLVLASLAPACNMIDKEYGGRVSTFRGGESAEETLIVMGVPIADILKKIKEGCQYDKELEKFGKNVIKLGDYKKEALKQKKYLEYGTMEDTLRLRIVIRFESEYQPIIRAHFEPYDENMSRIAMLNQYKEWCRVLGRTGYLDVLSIGSSQLS